MAEHSQTSNRHMHVPIELQLARQLAGSPAGSSGSLQQRSELPPFTGMDPPAAGATTCKPAVDPAIFAGSEQCIALRKAADPLWIKHFTCYVKPSIPVQQAGCTYLFSTIIMLTLWRSLTRHESLQVELSPASAAELPHRHPHASLFMLSYTATQ